MVARVLGLCLSKGWGARGGDWIFSKGQMKGVDGILHGKQPKAKRKNKENTKGSNDYLRLPLQHAPHTHYMALQGNGR